jgi:hypothetical protein
MIDDAALSRVDEYASWWLTQRIRSDHGSSDRGRAGRCDSLDASTSVVSGFGAFAGHPPGRAKACRRSSELLTRRSFHSA